MNTINFSGFSFNLQYFNRTFIFKVALKNFWFAADISLMKAKMNIVHKHPSQLSLATRKTCRNLTLRKNGLMASLLSEEAAFPESKSETILVYENKQLVAWSLIVDRNYVTGYDHITRKTRRTYHENNNFMFNVYVRHNHRRKGLAKLLLSKAMNNYSGLHVCPWDENSSRFFTQYENKVKIDKAFEEEHKTRTQAWNKPDETKKALSS